MKSFTRIAILALAVAGLTTLGTVAVAAPAKADKPAKAEKAPKAEAKPKAVKLGGELDKLDLSEQQKTDIQKIRTDTKEAVAKLQAEIKKLNEEAKTKEMAILTPEQQTKLKAAEEEAKKAAEAKKAESKKDHATTATAPAK